MKGREGVCCLAHFLLLRVWYIWGLVESYSVHHLTPVSVHIFDNLFCRLEAVTSNRSQRWIPGVGNLRLVPEPECGDFFVAIIEHLQDIKIVARYVHPLRTGTWHWHYIAQRQFFFWYLNQERFWHSHDFCFRYRQRRRCASEQVGQ